MKARSIFRPLRVPAVWLAIAALISVAVTVWWFSTVESTVNYRLAFEQSWQFFASVGMFALIVRITPDSEDGYITIRSWSFLFVLLLFSAMTRTMIAWVNNVWPVLLAFNVSKALLSLGLLLATLLFVGLTLRQVYTDNKSKVVVPKVS